MSSPDAVGNLPGQDADQNPDAHRETHMRVKGNMDAKLIQNLEYEILRAAQNGVTVVDPLFNAGLPDASVAAGGSTVCASSLFTVGGSMESFSLNTIATFLGQQPVEQADAIGAPGQDNQTQAATGCCGARSGPAGGDGGGGVNADGTPAPTTYEKLPDLLPPAAKEDAGKICLVLDLDETLVHSSFLSIPHADFRFVLGTDENQVGVFVCIRPGAQRFLKELGQLFEIVVFTASCQPYADPVVDYIDPGRVVKFRLYREACTNFGGNFVKDLSRMNRGLERIIIIDNSPAAYLLQPYNAIGIQSWFDEPMDDELLKIMDFLKQNYRVRNVYEMFSE